MASSKVNDPVGLSVKRNNATISLRISDEYSGPIHKFISIIGAPPPPSGNLLKIILLIIIITLSSR